MIKVDALTKNYGKRVAVDNVSFEVPSGRVTGFVGPNGAGKSTTMRMMVGLTRPDGGEVRYAGTSYGDLVAPAYVVGSVLDARCMHPGRTARNHLRAMAALSRLPTSRVDEVLVTVGLESAAGQRAGGFSLGMRQRLALAGALLAKPEVLLLDEPANGRRNPTFSSEVQHGTLAGAVTAQPARWVLATAKSVIAAAVGVGLGLTGLVAGFGGALLGGVEVGETVGLASTVGWAAAFTALASLLGLGIGMISRHSAAAISGLLIWWLVIENLMAAFLDAKFARFMPFSAGNGMLGVSNGPESGLVGDTLSITQNALVFGGYALAAVVIGTVLLQRRDTN